MDSFDTATQEHLNQGNYCALLAGMWLYCESSYAKLLLLSHLGVDGNSYYIYPPEERGVLETLVESGELDQDASAELESALADQGHQAITEFGLRRVRRFFPGVVPIGKWEQEIVRNGSSNYYMFEACWGETWNGAILEALILFEEFQNSYPCLCLRPGTNPHCKFLLDILTELGVLRSSFVDGYYVIENIVSDELGGGGEGLRLLGRVIDLLLRSHSDALGYQEMKRRIQHGVRIIWPDIEDFDRQDPEAVATAILMVGFE